LGIVAPWPGWALILVNSGAVAEKHQSVENSRCSHSDMAAPEFIFYSQPPPSHQRFRQLADWP
jgi:hypothetical protein